MTIDNCIIIDARYESAYKKMLKVLNCNALWVMCLDNKLLNVLVTDKFLWEHYWDKKYYLQDPTIQIKLEKAQSPWQITLGTDCDAFNKNGFLYDLYKLFNIDEFISIEKNAGSKRYCFRFFTKNNRFIFMNKFINNMPIIKCFIHAMTTKFTAQFTQQTGLSIADLQLKLE